MLMINATRHLDASFGVYPRPSIWAGPCLRQFGERTPPATRQLIKRGVGNVCFDQIMGRPAGLP